MKVKTMLKVGRSAARQSEQAIATLWQKTLQTLSSPKFWTWPI